MRELAATDAPAPRAIEFHSIDYIPVRERHGKVRDQFTLWFLGNAELATLAVGLIGISLGLSLWWALVATVLGIVFGTFFMAFHSVQGPRLGIPQLIQSRPQFGYYGALIPQAIGLFLYIGFNFFNTIIAGQAFATVTHVNTTISILLMAGVGLVLALGGYDWLHFVQRWGTYIFLPVFGVFTIGVIFTTKLPAAQQGIGTFQLTPFLIVLLVVGAYQLSQAPYVSDYSRYLDRKITSAQTFFWTYGGSAIGAFWMIALGALLLAGNPTAQTVDAVQAGGDKIFNGFGTITLTIAWIGLASVIGLNNYCGSLTTITILDVVRPVKPSVALRVVTVSIIAVLGTAGALLLPSNFLASYSTFLALLTYFLIPWTAINLVDYYLVRKGQYAITEIFNPSGIYHRWGWRGLVSYFVGFAVMVPFFSITLFGLTGPIAKAAGGADFSLFVGLPVAAILYFFLSRNIDHTVEENAARASERQLEGGAGTTSAAGQPAPAPTH